MFYPVEPQGSELAQGPGRQLSLVKEMSVDIPTRQSTVDLPFQT
jgi:hypothetical protein